MTVVLLSAIFSLSMAEAKKFDSGKMLKEAKKMEREAEDGLDCALYNAAMTDKYIAQGKTWHMNLTCDPDEQWKYDKLNGIEPTYQEDADKGIDELRDDAYEDEDKEDGEDRDDDKKKNKKDKNNKHDD